MSSLARIVLPPAPTTVSASQASATSALVTWSRVPTATSYNVSRNGTTVATGLTARTFTDTGLANGSYTYRVESANSNGTGPASSPAAVTIGDITAPTAPGISATAVSASAISVALVTPATDATGIARYELEWSATGTGGWTVLSTNVAFPYSHTGLTASTVYYYRARAVDSSPSANVGPYSANASATTQAVASGPIQFAQTTFTESLTQGAANSVDFDARLSAGAPAAGWAFEGTLPAGMSFNATTGVLSGTPPTIEAPVIRLAASNVSRAEAEWALRSTAPGVYWATGFDTDADVVGPNPAAADSNPRFWESYSFQDSGTPGPNPFSFRQGGAGIAGKSALRLTYPASRSGTPGGWRRLFREFASSDTSADAARRIYPEDTPLYIVVEFKPDGNAILVNPSNWKLVLLAGYGKTGWGATCQSNEIPLFHNRTSWGSTLMHYTACGSTAGTFTESFSPGPRVQNRSDLGAGVTDVTRRYCLYDTYVSREAGGACYKFRSNVWTAVKFYIVNRSDGLLDFRTWVQYEGSTQWALYNEFLGWPQWSRQSISGDFFNTLNLTLQTTGRSTGDRDFLVDVNGVIVSQNDIAPRTVWA